MKKVVWTAIGGLVLTSFGNLGFSQTVQFWDERCNFKCERVPDLDKSHIRFGSKSSKPLPSKLDILVWNVHKALNRSFKKDFRELSERSDLMLIQEYSGNGTFRKFAEFQWDVATSFIQRGGMPTGVSLASRTSPLSLFLIRSRDREPFALTPKMQIAATYPIEGRDDHLLAISIHGILAKTGGALRSQLKQLSAMILNHRGPVLYAGDFNTWTDRRMRILSYFMESHGLEKVRWDEDKRRGWILDHAYVRGLKILSSRVITGLSSSDHEPLVIEAEL